MPKLNALPNRASVMPATAGPTTRARLNEALFRAMAWSRSLRGTTSATNDWRTGMSKALVMPRIRARTWMCQISTTPA